MSEKLRNLELKILEILKLEWDPVCVGDQPSLSNEYLKYARQLAEAMMGNHAGESEIYSMLLEFELHSIGLEVDEDTRRKTASLIASLLNVK